MGSDTHQGLDEVGLTACARRLGELLRAGDVVLLEGPMGAGKTTFTRALARGLNVDEPGRVRSPSFNICLVHAGPLALAHMDLFRLGERQGDGEPVGTAAFEALGLGELAAGGGGGWGGGLLPDQHVLVVEWADLWATPPDEHLRIRIDRPAGGTDARSLTLWPAGERAGELARAWSSSPCW